MSEYSQELENLYKLARRAKADGNNENAQKYYDMISIQNPDDWEAAFYSVYYQAMQTNIAGISNSAVRVQNAARSTFDIIANSNESDIKKGEYAREILSSVEKIGNLLDTAAKNHYNGIDYNVRDRFTTELKERESAVKLMRYNAILKAGSLFGREVDIYLKSMFNMCISNSDFANAEKANSFIVKYDPSFDGVTKINSKREEDRRLLFCFSKAHADHNRPL